MNLTIKEKDLLNLAKQKGYLIIEDGFRVYATRENARKALQRLAILGLIKQNGENPNKFNYIAGD